MAYSDWAFDNGGVSQPVFANSSFSNPLVGHGLQCAGSNGGAARSTVVANCVNVDTKDISYNSVTSVSAFIRKNTTGTAVTHLGVFLAGDVLVPSNPDTIPGYFHCWNKNPALSQDHRLRLHIYDLSTYTSIDGPTLSAATWYRIRMDRIPLSPTSLRIVCRYALASDPDTYTTWLDETYTSPAATFVGGTQERMGWAASSNDQDTAIDGFQFRVRT